MVQIPSFPPLLPHFDNLPDAARVNIDIVTVVTGRSRASLYRDIRAGRFPKPIHVGMGPHSAARWSVGDIRAHLARTNPNPFHERNPENDKANLAETAPMPLRGNTTGGVK